LDSLLSDIALLIFFFCSKSSYSKGFGSYAPMPGPKPFCFYFLFFYIAK
jgi:hypothetical protein